MRLVALAWLLGCTAAACAEGPQTGDASLSGNHVHWAFQPPRDVALPTVQRTDVVRSPIDPFILERLALVGLQPSPLAEKHTLLRRVKFDLIGLPPTQEEAEAYAADDSPDALERVLDRLLASPHYGERWGRYWLDAARYADTKGYVYTDREERRFIHSYVYRDWVLRALNEDLPYDQFLIQQIAADQLVTPSNRQALAAMGFLTLGRRFAGNVYEIIDDRIDTLCRATLGLTVSCARCHDHKFDPIPTEDYYSLYGVFSGSYDLPVSLVDEPQRTDAYVAYEEELNRRRKEFDDALRGKSNDVLDRVRARTGEYLAAVLDVESLPTENEYRFLDADDLNPVFVRQWHAFLLRPRGELDPIFAPLLVMADVRDEEFSARISRWLAKSQDQLNRQIAATLAEPLPASKRELAQRMGKAFEQVHQAWQAALEQARKDEANSPTALPDEADEALRLALYGPQSPIAVPNGPINEIEWCFDEGTRVQLGALQMKIDQWIIQSAQAPPHAVYLVDRTQQYEPRILVSGNPATKGDAVPRRFLEVLSGGNRRPFEQGSGRLDLARAIASPDNPLTARVLVNRVWLHHFGSGLVETPSDFGLRSDPPTHPELLDWLARRFIADGWSLKKLHRLIVLSHTYQQSSRGHAEASKIDPDNRLLARMNRRRLDYEALRDSLLAVSGTLSTRLGGRPEMVSDEAPGRRRGLYSFVDRLNVPSVMRVFDVASPDVHSPQRHATTIPQQSLYLLNSPFMLERARSLAARPEIGAAGSMAERIDALYRIVFARAATAREKELGLRMAEATLAEPVVVPPPLWTYGRGAYDAATGKVNEFHQFPLFTGTAWQSAVPEDQPSPDGTLTAAGGHAGRDPQRAVVRRWIAPADTTITISGKVEHEPEQGDGVKAIIVSSRAGELASFHVRHSSAETTLRRIEVKKDDMLDFLTFCRVDAAHDDFHWAPVIRRVGEAAPDEPNEWNAARDFSGPSPVPLTPWEKYVQVLLLTNEFAFVD